MSYLVHYGTPRHSGRYPWGSGENPYQRNKNFMGYVRELRSQGLTDAEIAKGMGMTRNQLTARLSKAKSDNRKEDEAMALRLKDKGYSNVAIGKRMGINESTVRNLLDPELSRRNDILESTTNLLRERVNEMNYIDVGLGVENHLGVTRTRLKNSLEILKDEGYHVDDIYVDQLGTGKKTTLSVLYKPDIEYKEVYKNRDKIATITDRSEDGGKTYQKIEPPKSIDLSRVYIRYKEDGGEERDGLIELRRGIDDISLGAANYAQVRIAVNNSHYMKGMAVYGDIPNGYDVVYNTNKKKGTRVLGDEKTSVMKPFKSDPDNPFGATIKMDNQLVLAQRYYTDSNGKKQQSCLNIVNEEGNWGSWRKTISSQMLSKQDPKIAKQQLKVAYDLKKDEYDEIMSLTNPVIKKKLLTTFADSCDSAASHLKAAAFPRQESKVLLPFPDMKDNEVYAPTFKNGDHVVLIRFPHGGTFEIPELTVNNNVKSAKNAIGNAKDAIGINKKVADRLSGADFDGDSVLIIPNNNKTIKTSPALKGLENFDPKSYQDKSLPKMKNKTKQREMGSVSNLITDMTIKGASTDEICRAVKHSMVVIDAQKHSLDYKQSYKDNNIAELKAKYQGLTTSGGVKGASTLISRASSEARVPQRKEGVLVKDPLTGKTKRQYIDPKTGNKLYTETGSSYTKLKKSVNKETGKITYVDTGKIIQRTTSVTKMNTVSDAHELSSGTRIESIYADHANSLKVLANTARKETLSIPNLKYDPSAKSAYSKEVESLNKKLIEAGKNKPLERKAQLLANSIVSAAKADNPDMDADDVKKLNGRALTEARIRVGSGKAVIKPTEKEWEAIQAGAISHNKLTQIIDNSDLDQIKSLATPRTTTGLPAAKLARAESMLNRGYTQSEVAEYLGVSVSTLTNALKSA